MHIAEAVKAVAKLWPSSPFPFTGGGAGDLERLAREFSLPFPDELRTYARDFAPRHTLVLEGVANPHAIYGLKGSRRLGFKQSGYSVVGRRPLTHWSEAWFLLADEGADPSIIDLSRGDTQVLAAMHGQGEWSFWPIAETIGQYILCAAALHYVHVTWSDEIHDEDCDYLPPAAAKWLLPRMRQWAGEHYDRWCGVYANA